MCGREGEGVQYGRGLEGRQVTLFWINPIWENNFSINPFEGIIFLLTGPSSLCSTIIVRNWWISKTCKRAMLSRIVQRHFLLQRWNYFLTINANAHKRWRRNRKKLAAFNPFFKEQFGVEPLLDPEDMATTTQVAMPTINQNLFVNCWWIEIIVIARWIACLCSPTSPPSTMHLKRTHAKKGREMMRRAPKRTRMNAWILAVRLKKKAYVPLARRLLGMQVL